MWLWNCLRPFVRLVRHVRYGRRNSVATGPITPNQVYFSYHSPSFTLLVVKFIQIMDVVAHNFPFFTGRGTHEWPCTPNLTDLHTTLQHTTEHTTLRLCSGSPITVTPWWARWRLKSPASRLLAQPFVYSGADQRKRQSTASLAFVRGIHRWPVNSPHKGPVTGKCFHLMTSQSGHTGDTHNPTAHHRVIGLCVCG